MHSHPIHLPGWLGSVNMDVNVKVNMEGGSTEQAMKSTLVASHLLFVLPLPLERYLNDLLISSSPASRSNHLLSCKHLLLSSRKTLCSLPVVPGSIFNAGSFRHWELKNHSGIEASSFSVSGSSAWQKCYFILTMLHKHFETRPPWWDTINC